MDHKHESDDMDHITKAEGERILERLKVAMEPVPRDEELWAWLEEEDKDGYTDGDYLREAEIAIQVARQRKAAAAAAATTADAATMTEEPVNSFGKRARTEGPHSASQAVSAGEGLDWEENLPNRSFSQGVLGGGTERRGAMDRGLRETVDGETSGRRIGRGDSSSILLSQNEGRCKMPRLMEPSDLLRMQVSGQNGRASSQAFTVSPMNITPSASETPDLVGHDFPVALRLEGEWKGDVPLDLKTALEDALMGHITGPSRIKAWNAITEMEKACVLTKVIGKAKQGSFGRGCAAMTATAADEACSTCPGATPGVKGGRRAVARPCAVVITLDGRLTLGFLPLPVNLRAGKVWTEKGYWVNGG